MKLDYDEIREIYRAEKNSSRLAEVNEDFFESVSKFFSKQRQEYLKSLHDLSGSKAKSFSNLRKIVVEIFSLREKKLLNKALVASRTGELLNDKMSTEEKQTLKQLLNVLSKHRKVLDEIISMPEKPGKRKGTIRLRVLQEVPAFMGADMKEYGPFEKGKQLVLSEKIGSLLIARKLAEEAEE